MTIRRFEDVVAWQKARALAKDVYAVTRNGAFSKDFALIDQIRRAVVSIGSNVAEGFDRGNTKEFVNFLGIAKGSAAEVRSQLYTALDVGYLSEGDFEALQREAEDVARLIAGLIKSLRTSSIAGVRYHKPVEESPSQAPNSDSLNTKL